MLLSLNHLHRRWFFTNGTLIGRCDCVRLMGGLRLFSANNKTKR
nr:MAG TPA: hypothetical protein [Bacteriophage sp.]